ncbi:MAG: Ig-like domain-containing protein [Gemmatimonadaceae bacterium]
MAASILACGGSGGTGPAPVFSSVAVAPSSPNVAVGATTALTATAKDQNGAVFSGAMGATWSSATPAVATVDATTGIVSGVANGSSVITASITIGSITHTGSQSIAVTTPTASGDVTATTTLNFDPGTVTVSRSAGTASVTWHFQSVAHTVTWDAQPGSVTDIGTTSSASVARDFTVAGTYHYHCSIHSGMAGVVVVQ